MIREGAIEQASLLLQLSAPQSSLNRRSSIAVGPETRKGPQSAVVIGQAVVSDLRFRYLDEQWKMI
jgi:hypothetical protein